MPAKRTGIATRPSWRDSTDGYGAALRSSSKNLSHSLTPWWSDNLKLTSCRSNSWRRSWKNRMLKKRWRQTEKKSNSLSPTYSWWCLALFSRPLFPLLFIIYNRYTLSACSLLIKTLCVITYVWQQLRDSSQERLALLEARLTEEQDWRKQLEADLSAAQAALRKDKEVHWSPQKINTITKIAEIQFFKVKSNPRVLLTRNEPILPVQGVADRRARAEEAEAGGQKSSDRMSTRENAHQEPHPSEGWKSRSGGKG